MLKIEVDTLHEAKCEHCISVKSEIDATSFDAVGEIYAMLKHLEMNYPSELARAVELLVIKHEEKNDG